MLTGSFRSYSIAEITIAPDRQRKELSGIEELAASIKQIGLIHPVILTPEGVLVAGERRLRAHQHLGYTHVMVQFTNELAKEELEAIELEENIKRKSLAWKDEVAAVSRIHTLRLMQDPEWTADDTADLLSVSASFVSKYLKVSEYIGKGEELVINSDNLVTAYNICLRKDQRAEEVTNNEIDSAIDDILAKPMSVNPVPKRAEVSGNLPLPETKQKPVPYLLADFREWAKQPYTGPKFNFLHCDFPYGINYDKHNGGATGLLGKYADTPELYLECLRALKTIMADRVADSAHLMFWLSARHEIIHQSRLALEDMGWKLNPVPLIWHRSDNSGILPDPQRGPRQVYEVCLFGSRGDRKIVQAVSNLYAHPKTKEVHASEKPIAMLQHFFRMFVDESTVMLDPTMGSGNSILAAEESGAKQVLGLEALPEIYENACAYRDRVKRRD